MEGMVAQDVVLMRGPVWSFGGLMQFRIWAWWGDESIDGMMNDMGFTDTLKATSMHRGALNHGVSFHEPVMLQHKYTIQLHMSKGLFYKQ